MPDRQPAPSPAVPQGTRVYAVGDIHGRDDLLARLHAMMADDFAGAPPGTRGLAIYLGDYVDRGADSKAVLDRLIGGAPAGLAPVYLKGNHEDLMLRFLAGDGRAGPVRMANGGGATLASYDVAPPDIDARSLEAAGRALQAALPPAHRAFLGRLALRYRVGDYAFAHAGVRPGVAFERQDEADLLWIRRPFLDHAGDFGAVVVHGHSIAPAPVVRENRIGIDTGAYASGRLTCLVLEGTDRRFLAT
ncbi:MAG: serine/threonine protein phosphatase [Chloroflexi bacterium]|nr:serine/threonine protein phosphatase [Chloroflexota bacterium]